jgi:hypothetical protein
VLAALAASGGEMIDEAAARAARRDLAGGSGEPGGLR